MPGPPAGRDLPGLKFQDRGAVFLSRTRAARHGIMENNRYSILQEDQQDGATAMDSSEPRVKKPPPIEVSNKRLSELKSIISDLKDIKSEIQYRLTTTKFNDKMRETIKIYTQSDEDYVAIGKCLEQKKLEFSTHPLYDDKKIKICLYGLDTVAIDQIKGEVKRLMNVEPADVKMLEPKDGYTGESRIYLLYFKRSDKVKVSDLREKVRGLFHIGVRYQYYSPRKFGPTQCSNCLDFSHGASLCHRNPKCIRCSGPHSSKSCNHLPPEDPTSKEKRQIPKDKVKCANCGQGHTANYNKCPYRAAVIDKQRRFRPQKRPPPPPLDHDFPALEVKPANVKKLTDLFNHKQDAHETRQNETNSHMQAMQRFLDTQNQMMTMMSSMMSQMTNLLSTVTDLINKITKQTNDQK